MVLYIGTRRKLVRGIRRDVATRVHLYLQGGDWVYLTYCERRGLSRPSCSYGRAFVYALFELLGHAFPYSIEVSPRVFSDLARVFMYGYQFSKQRITILRDRYVYYMYDGWVSPINLPRALYTAYSFKTPSGEELDLSGRLLQSVHTIIPTQLGSLI